MIETCRRIPKQALWGVLVALGLQSHLVQAQAVPGALQAEVPGKTGLRDQPVADYQARCKALMASIRKEEGLEISAEPGQKQVLVIVSGANPAQVADFEEQRFRQTNEFAYLCGFDEPGGVLVLNAGRDQSTLYVREHAGSAAGFGEGQAELVADAATAQRLGVDRVAGIGHLLGDLFTALQDPAPLSQAGGRRRGPGGRADSAVIYTDLSAAQLDRDDARSALMQFLRKGAPGTAVKQFASIVGEMRKVKTESELRLLQRAIDITGEAERATARMLAPGVYEFQLEGRILGTFAEYGAFRPGFKSIVGSGPNSCIPHYFLNLRQIEAGDLVVVDIGAEYQNYTADVTRTFPASGKFTPRQRELYQLVLDTQAHCAQRFETGKTTLYQMNGWAQEFLRKSPLRACAADGKEYSMDHFFIHGLGHYLGMDVHDVGNGGIPMQPGEVFTIEPGVYIPSESIGIRIEDDYLVTEKGLVKMSEKIASDPDAVEAWMAAGR